MVLRVFLALAAAVLATEGFAQGLAYLQNTPPLIERLTPEVMALAFPAAVRVEMMDDGGPTAAAAYGADDEVIGYVFSTLDVTRTPGYSGVPFDIIAGVDLAGKITGATALFYSEPYINGDSRRTQRLMEFLPRMNGMTARIGGSDGPAPSFIAGATISARAMRGAIREGGSIVLGARSDAMVVTEPTVDTTTYLMKTSEELLADGALTKMRLTVGDVQARLAELGFEGRELEKRLPADPEATYIELLVGLASAPIVGRNAAGVTAYEKYVTEYPKGTNAIFLGSNGILDFQGFRFQNRSSNYTLDQVRILQGDKVFDIHRDFYTRARGGSIGVAEVTGLVFLPADSGFDPLAPFTVELSAYLRGAGNTFERFKLAEFEYQVPPSLVLMPPPPPMPVWMEAWVEGKTNLIILGVMLTALTLILGFQHQLTRWRAAHRWIRLAFLGFTVIWLGWMVGGQLSIVHLLNYLQAPFSGLDWTFYLAEPLIVVLSVYVAISLLILGRGVFCGWLCPFGALQEILATIARALRLPTWNPSEGLQKHLWMGKYVSLAVIVVLTFTLPDAGAMAAEVEPFKTAITAQFARALPYVVYAGALLALGLFTERAFCRFLCPLGGALALLDRLHLVNLLKRRPECGSPCHLCERSCPVRAIASNGKIEMAECFQCLDCQVEYYDDKRCPPLARQRKQRERAVARGPQTVFAYTPKAAQ